MRITKKECINCHLIQSKEERRCYHCNSSLRLIIQVGIKDPRYEYP